MLKNTPNIAVKYEALPPLYFHAHSFFMPLVTSLFYTSLDSRDLQLHFFQPYPHHDSVPLSHTMPPALYNYVLPVFSLWDLPVGSAAQ